MNRHTPRDVIYGPTKYGGRNISDLRIEQPILHLRTNMGHMRRDDNAGKALRATLYDTQIEAGITTPLYQTDPSLY